MDKSSPRIIFTTPSYNDAEKLAEDEILIHYRIETTNPISDTKLCKIKRKFGAPFEIENNHVIRETCIRKRKYNYDIPLNDPEAEKKRLKAKAAFKHRRKCNEELNAKIVVKVTLMCKREKKEIIIGCRVKTTDNDTGFFSKRVAIGSLVNLNYCHCTTPQQQQSRQSRKRKYNYDDNDDNDDEETKRKKRKALNSFRWHENNFKERKLMQKYFIYISFFTSKKTFMNVFEDFVTTKKQ